MTPSTRCAVIPLILMNVGCFYELKEDYGFSESDLSARMKAARRHQERESARRLVRPSDELPEELSLSAAIQLSETNNRSLARARRELERARLEERVAEAKIFVPSLTVSGDSADKNVSSRLGVAYASKVGLELEPFIETEFDDTRDPTNSSGLGITVSRRVFNVSERVRLRLPITRAAKDLLVSANFLRLVQRTLRFSVFQAFYNIQRASVRMKVRENRVKDAQEFLKTIKERLKFGFAAPVEEANALINLNQAEADLDNEQTNLRNAMDSLLSILGYELESPFSITPEDVASIPDFQYDVARDMERTRVYHEELANQRAEIGFAKKEIRVQKDLLKPQVSLGLTAQHRMRDDFPFGSNDPATDPVGVELSYQTTLDGKKADKARLEQLKTEQEERHLSLKDSETELERRLRALARRMELLKNRIRLAEVRLEAQKRRLQATLRKYEQGDVDNLEVTRAKQDLDAAEIRLLDARIDLRLAIAEYESILPPAAPE